MEKQGTDMLTIPPETLRLMQDRAREMITSNEVVVDVCTPEGQHMYNISSDASRLKPPLIEFDIDGTTFYVGEQRSG